MQPLGTRLPTEHLRVLKNLLKRVYAFQIELESGSVGFLREGKTRVPGEKPLGVKERTNNKLNPGFEPGPDWWMPLRYLCSPKGDVTRDDSQRRFLGQHIFATLEQCCDDSKRCRNKVARLSYAKIVVANRLV